MVVVSDTTTLSNLLIIEHTHLLASLYNEIAIPQAVAEELHKLTSHELLVNQFLSQNWVMVRAVQRDDYVNLIHQQIDAGEAEAITLALELNANLLIIDEKKGRVVAKSVGVPVIGTLGILVLAKQVELVTNVGELIHRLATEAGFWIHDSLRKQVLESVGE
ncbi:DUF3368 domain-containing protein [Spirosoma knui]